MVLSGLLIGLSLLLGWVGAPERFSRGSMLAAAVAAGLPVALTAWHSLRARHLSIELLVTVGAVIIGEVWEAAAVTFLFDLGGYLEARTMARTRRVIGERLDVAPTMAIVLREGETRGDRKAPAGGRLGAEVLPIDRACLFLSSGTANQGASVAKESHFRGIRPKAKNRVGGRRRGLR